MVFPIGDDDSRRATTPVVNYLLIAANVLVFVLFQGLALVKFFALGRGAGPAPARWGRY